MPDEFSATVKNNLAKRAGERCSICKVTTSKPDSSNETLFLNLGEAAHISGRKYGKHLRFDANMTSDTRSSISNAIWLCKTCHKLIDSDSQKYTIGNLHQIKESHELDIAKGLGDKILKELISLREKCSDLELLIKEKSINKKIRRNIKSYQLNEIKNLLNGWLENNTEHHNQKVELKQAVNKLEQLSTLYDDTVCIGDIEFTEFTKSVADAKIYVDAQKRQLNNDLNGALKVFEFLLEKNGRNYEYWYWRGKTLTLQNRYIEAISSYEESLRLNVNYYHAWNDKGYTHMLEGDYSEAIKSFKKSIKINPEYISSQINLSHALTSIDKYDEALTVINGSLEFNPSFAPVWLNKGYTLILMERNQEAFDANSRCIELDAGHAEAWCNQSVVLIALQQYDRAVHCADEAIKLNPLHYFSFNSKGCALNCLGRFEEALVELNEAIRLQPIYPNSFRHKAVSLAGLKQYSLALEAANNAIMFDEKYTLAYATRAAILKSLGDDEKALLDIYQVNELGPSKKDRRLFLQEDFFEELRSSGLLNNLILP